MATDREHLRHVLTFLREAFDDEDTGVSLDPNDIDAPQRPGRGTFRPQAELEREALSVPAFGYLINLVRLGQISAEQMETLIQFAVQLAASPLDPADLGPLLEHVVFSRGRPDGAWGVSETSGRPH